MSTLNTARLTVIASEITSRLDTIALCSIEIGEYLNEAKSQFKKASDFYSWAESSVNLKKAQVCLLVSLANEFSAEKDNLKGMSVRALRALMQIKDEEVKQEVTEIAIAASEQGKPLTEKEVSDVSDEVSGVEPEKKPEVKPMTEKQAQKAVAQAEEKAAQVKAKADKALDKAAKARDTAIKESRTLVKQLEEAQAKIEEQAKIIADKDGMIAQLAKELNAARDMLVSTDAEHVEELDEAIETDELDLPWFTEEEEAELMADDEEDEDEIIAEVSDMVDAEKQLAVFKETYTDLKAIEPRQVANNTRQAAEMAQIEVINYGKRNEMFVVGGEELTARELRAKVK